MKKATILVFLCFAVAVMLPKTTVHAQENLLINGNAENEMNGWVDPDNLWFPSAPITPKEGKSFFWPSKKGCSTSYIYQDIDLSTYEAGTWVELSGWLANWDQSPNDEAILQLEFLDSKGVALTTISRSQRNPEWNQHTIQCQIAKSTVTARVKLIANRYVGNDNDAYFDDLSFTVLDGSYKQIYITGNTSTAKSGDVIQLKANNGSSTDPKKFIWTSSYDALASVNEMGEVTFYGSNSEEVTIYAKDAESNMVGAFYINSDKPNDSPMPDQVKALKKGQVTNKSITLQWDKCNNAQGYYVYQYNTSNKKWILAGTIKDSNSTGYTLKKLKSATSYKFKVAAYVNYGKEIYLGKYSNTLTVTTLK